MKRFKLQRLMLLLSTVALVAAVFPGTAGAQDSGDAAPAGECLAVGFSFEQLQPAAGFFITEPWVGLHNGDFDLFNAGERASAGLEALAEGGNTELLGAEFAQPGRLQATIGNGNVQFISPGETVEGSIAVRNAANYRYFSFASMLIPSNDAFIGNDDPLAFEIFDAAGNFTGPLTIDVFASDIYDSGTEVNDGQGAAGFSLGLNGDGGTSTDDPTSTVGLHPDLLANIENFMTAAGTTVTDLLTPDEAIARITVSCGGPINTQSAVGPIFDGYVMAAAPEAAPEPAPAATECLAVGFSFEQLQPAAGFFITEPWVGLHNGDFDLFNAGERASAGLEALAEGGNTELLGAEFAQPGRLQATIGNGNVQFISPGETVEGSIAVRNAANYRYFSFASMLIPSNDAFIGNDDPLAFEIFDAAGNFTGPLTIDVFASDIYDSGTEVNDGQGAAGFSLGLNGDGGTSTDDPTSTVGLHPDLLANIENFMTAAGTTVTDLLTPDEAIARITVSCGGPINTQSAVGPIFDGYVMAAAPEAAPELAITGASTNILFALGVVLVAFGAVTVRSQRRFEH